MGVVFVGQRDNTYFSSPCVRVMTEIVFSLGVLGVSCGHDPRKGTIMTVERSCSQTRNGDL